MRHLSTKQRERPLDSVPVVITDVACEPAVFFEPDFPAGALRRADRILAHVLASPDADRNHGFCGAVAEPQYWIGAWDARCKFGATWRRPLRCPGTAAKQHQRDVDADSLFRVGDRHEIHAARFRTAMDAFECVVGLPHDETQRIDGRPP